MLHSGTHHNDVWFAEEDEEGGVGGGGVNKYLGDAESTLAGIQGKNFTKIEAYAGMAERLGRDLAIEEAFQDKIKDTLEHNNQSYVDWCALSDKEKNNNKVKPTVTYDTGWQNRSSGSIYDSSSGHAFIIGGRSKGIIGMVLYSKAFRECNATEKRGEEAEEHECPKNFEGSSKTYGGFCYIEDGRGCIL